MLQQTMRDEDDQTLLQRAVNGDAEALGLLYDRYGKFVFSLALRITGDRSLAEQITQDTFLQFWNTSAPVPAENEPIAPQLRTRAHRLAIDELRSRRGSSRRREFNPPVELAPAEHIGDEALAELCIDQQRALAGLPPSQREAIEFMFFGGLSPQEIAQWTACPLTTIYTRLRVGMEKLRAIFPHNNKQFEVGGERHR